MADDKHIATDQPHIVSKTDKVETLTLKERQALDSYLQKDHISPLPHAHDDTEIRSRGEKIFNISVYKGIGWITNAAISVYLTDLLIHGKGRPYCDQAIHSLAPKFERFLGDHPEKALNRAESSVFCAGLFTGGTILLYPIKKLEDNKARLVKFIDHTYNQTFGVDTTELAIQKNAHNRLEKEPTPSWGNVLLGRVLGTIAVVSVMVGIFRNRDVKAAELAAKKTTEAFKESESSFLNKIASYPAFQRTLGITFMEMYTSFIAEEVLYLTTRIYKGLKRKEMLEQAGNDNVASPPVLMAPEHTEPLAAKDSPQIKAEPVVELPRHEVSEADISGNQKDLTRHSGDSHLAV